MKKKDLKRRINELNLELHESVWYHAQEKDAHNVTQSALESYQEEVADLQATVDDQLLMLEGQVTRIVELMREVKKLKKLKEEIKKLKFRLSLDD